MDSPSTILIAEDDPDTRSLLEYLLTDAGYRHYSTGSGEEALRLVAEYLPDVVILDWMLPDKSGLEVCRALRQTAPLYVHILMMTARGAASDVVIGLDAGADDYLIKPVNLEELLARLRSLLRIHKLEQQLRREVERSIQRAQELAAVIDHIAEGILIVRPDGSLDRLNPAAADLLQLGPDRASSAWLVDFRQHLRLSPDGPALTEESCPIGRALAGLSTTGQDLIFDVGTGPERMLMVSASPVFGPDHRVAMVVGVLRDVTHDREVDRLKSQIISHVSHELRTPLAHIKGYGSTLLQPDVNLDRNVLQEFHQGIVDEADRLTRLVDDLLEMSRLDAAQVEVPVRDWCALADLIDHVLVRQRGMHHTHDIQAGVPYDLPRIRCDADQIERVLANLLDNAVKYTPPGGQVRISAHYTGQAVIVSVSDNGPGIPPKHAMRVFEKFYRVTNGPNGPSGTGLGLAICKGIIESHGGHIWLDSPGESGRGATFSFALPRG